MNGGLVGKRTSPSKHGKTQKIESPFIYGADSRYSNAMVYGTIDRSLDRKKEKLRIRKVRNKKSKVNYETIDLHVRSQSSLTDDGRSPANKSEVSLAKSKSKKMFRAKNNSIAAAGSPNDEQMTGKKKRNFTKFKMKTNIPRNDEKERETPNQRTLTLSAEKAASKLNIEENNDQSNRDSQLVNIDNPTPDSEKLKT